MAGSKRAKIKQKANDLIETISPSTSPPNVPEDDTLIDDLLAQIDSGSPIEKVEATKVLASVENSHESLPKTKKDPKQKFKERQMKKAAALAATYGPDDPDAEAQLAREKAEEETAIKAVCSQLGLEMYEINPDGHCLYSAVADQLAILGLISPQQAHYKTTRATAAAFMLAHADDFLPFLPSLEGEDGRGATSATGLLDPIQYAQYCTAVRDSGKWGGEPEITALCRAFNVPIHVAQWGSQPIVCHSPRGDQVDPRQPSVKLSYHRRMYGLGEHYNSLRPKKTALQTFTGLPNSSA